MASASEGDEVSSGCLFIRRNYLSIRILKRMNRLLQVQPMRHIPRNANDSSGKRGRATQGRKRREDAHTILFKWRGCAQSSHKSLKCSLRSSLQTTCYRWRRSDAIWGCRLHYSSCISAENHLLFSLNSPLFVVYIGVLRHPDSFSVDQRLIYAAFSAHRDEIYSHRGLKRL